MWGTNEAAFGDAKFFRVSLCGPLAMGMGMAMDWVCQSKANESGGSFCVDDANEAYFISEIT